METTLLVDLSRQGALRRQMDVVANNLANMNSTAFKASRLLFAEHLVSTPSGGERMGDALALVRDVASVRDLAVGSLRETGNDLDVATLCADALMNLKPWALWDIKTKAPAPDAPTLEVQRVLEHAFQLKGGKDHPGLLHLHIH